MKTLLIVWHSRTGGTQHMVQAAADAAKANGEVRVVCLPADAAELTHLLDAGAYLFAAPENLAALSGCMKEFFDRLYYPALGQLEGRPYALMVCAGSDGSAAARQMQRICTGWRLREVAPALIVCTHAQSPEAIAAPKALTNTDLARCAQLGETLSVGLASGIF